MHIREFIGHADRFQASAPSLLVMAVHADSHNNTAPQSTATGGVDMGCIGMRLALCVSAERGHPAHPLLAEVLCAEGGRAAGCPAAAEPADPMHAPADRLPPPGAVASAGVHVAAAVACAA